MKRRTIGFVAGVVIAVAVAAWRLPYRREAILLRQENGRLRELTSTQAKSEAALQEQVDALGTQLQASEARNPELWQAAASIQKQNRGAVAPEQGRGRSQPGADQEAIRFSKKNLPQVEFHALDDKFELTDAAKELLEVTPEESGRLNAVLAELRNRIQAHDTASTQPVAPAAVKDEDIGQFFRTRDGEKGAYRVPPFGADDQRELREWLNQSVNAILGDDRYEVFQKNSRSWLDEWLGGTEDKIVAFVARNNAEGQPEYEWMIKFNTPSFHGTMSAGPGGPAIPDKFSYLFEAAKHNPGSKTQ